MKTTRLSDKLAPKAFGTNDNEAVGGSGDKANKTVMNSSRELMLMPNIGATEKPTFLTPDTKKAFNYLWLEFIKAPIFLYFNLENHIWIEADTSGYAISGVLSQ